MAKEIPIEKMDEFCDRLFRVLDRADLLPLRLNEAAHSFEKYGRILASLIGRYDKIEAAFDEWETRALRRVDNKYRLEEIYPHIQELRDWMTDEENRQLFEGEGKKDNLNHFKRSLYGRLYTWLYPRRKLAATYAQIHAGNEAQFEPSAIDQHFASTAQSAHQTLGNVDEQALTDAKAFVLAKRSYYSSWKVDAEPSAENKGE